MSMFRSGVTVTTTPKRIGPRISIGATPPPASAAKVAAVSLGSFVGGTALVIGGLYLVTKGKR